MGVPHVFPQLWNRERGIFLPFHKRMVRVAEQADVRGVGTRKDFAPSRRIGKVVM
jgi:hypothetical protein